MSFQEVGMLEDLPLGKPKSKTVKKLVNSDRQAKIEAMAVSEFVWGKVKQHRFGLLLTASLVLNILFVWQFIANGVN